jgi:phage FluMu protein Com
VNLSQAGAAQAQKPTANVVKLKCGGCGKIVKAPPSLAGKKVKCPRCDSVFVVPGKAPAPAPVAPKPNAASGFDDPFAMPANQPMGFDDPLAMPANQLGTPVNQPSYSSAYGSGGAKGPGRRKTSSRSSGANPLVLPAIFLIVVSSIWLLLVLINVVFTIIGLVAVASEPNLVVDYPRLIGRIVGIFVGAIFNTIIIVGATKMLRLSDYRSAYTASILGMIPCCGGCIVLSIPFAIWAFVLLGDPAVKRRFKNR